MTVAIDKRRLTISLDEEDYAALQTIAETDDRSMSWVIGQAVKQYLDTVADARPDLLPRERQIQLPL